MNLFYKNAENVYYIGQKNINYFLTENNTKTGYTKITDIDQVDNFCETEINSGVSNDVDYKVCRSILANLINIKAGFDPADETTYIVSNWNLLSDSEKIIASKYFIVPVSLRDLVNTIDEQIDFGETFHKLSVKARKSRMDRAFSIILNRLTTADANVLIGDIEKDTGVGSLMALYITEGREGTIKGDPNGMYDFVKSTVATEYESTGLSTRAYTVIGMTDTVELADKIIDVLDKGLK